MAGKVKAKLDARRIRAKVEQSEALRDELRKQARRLARKANGTLKRKQAGYPDYSYRLSKKGEKPTAAVFTRSNHAKHSNAKHQTLAKLI